MTIQTRPIRVDVLKPNDKRISYRFAVVGGRACRFLKERHPIRVATSPVEADLMDGGALTVYGSTLLDLGLITESAPEFLAVHTAAEEKEETIELTDAPPVPIEQPVLFAEPHDGEEIVEVGRQPPAALTAKKAMRMKLADLRAIAEQHGLVTTDDSTKAEIVAALNL